MGATTEDRPGAQKPLQGSELLLAGVVTSLAPFISVLDLTLVNIILPHIAGSYGATPREATLAVTFFAIAQAISMPLSGWLAGRFGAAKVFHGALIGFAVASLLCGAAPTLEMLVIARILQGAFAGPIVPLSQSLLQRNFPPRWAPTALTAWSVSMMAGPLLGPTLGGYLADSIGWQWGFFINVPLVTICLLISIRCFAKRDAAAVKTPIDGVGLGLMIVWVGCLQAVLDYGYEKNWLASPFIATLAIIAACGFVAFLLWELTEKHPIIDLSVFRYPSFTAIAIAITISNGIITASSLMVYIWLQTHMGYTSTHAGFVSAMTGAPGLLAAPVIAWLARRVDMRWLATAGLVLCAVAILMRCGFNTSIDLFHLLIPQVVIGVAGSLYWGSMMAVGTSQVPPEKLSSAAGLLAFTRTMGFAAQVALLTTFWEMGTRSQRAALAGAAQANAPAALETLQAEGMGPAQALRALEHMVENEASLLSLQQMFIVAGAVVLACVICVWMAPKPRSGVAPGGGEP